MVPMQLLLYTRARSSIHVNTFPCSPFSVFPFFFRFFPPSSHHVISNFNACFCLKNPLSVFPCLTISLVRYDYKFVFYLDSFSPSLCILLSFLFIDISFTFHQYVMFAFQTFLSTRAYRCQNSRFLPLCFFLLFCFTVAFVTRFTCITCTYMFQVATSECRIAAESVVYVLCT